MNIKEQLIQYYRWLRQYDINDSHSGNASVRDGETIWLTPTGACADTLTAEELIPCRLGESPPQEASTDSPLHLAVYAKNTAANTVLHSHGAYTVALTLNGQDFSPPDYEGQLYFPKVPVITIPYAQYSARSPALVAEQLAHYPITVVKGHGVYAQAKSLNLAYKWTCSLELSAKTTVIARQAGTL